MRASPNPGIASIARDADAVVIASAGIAVSILLACSNIIVGLLAHSTSVVATGVEFAGDVLASSIVLIGMRVAARPADENHPYGHGRFETLSAFVVGAVHSRVSDAASTSTR